MKHSFTQTHHVAAHGLHHKVVLLGFSGGVLALFVRGMHAERGAVAGFCFVSALAVVQAWLVASEIAKARRLCGNIRNACYRGAHAKFRVVSLVGLCAIVRWCGVFHYRSVDRAACRYFTDR
jgi:Cu/Ag efflux pump CusA